MLDYTTWACAYGLSLEDRQEGMKEYILDSLKKRLQYFADKKEEAEKATYELGLIERDLIILAKEDIAGNFKLNIFAGLVSDTILHEAWRGSQDLSKEEDLTEEQRKSYKGAFDFATEMINRRLLKNDSDFKFEKIVRIGYDGYAYEFHYDYKGMKICLHIHNFDQVNFQNYLDVIHGYYISYERSPGYWCTAARSPEWEKLHDLFVEWYNKGERNDNE